MRKVLDEQALGRLTKHDQFLFLHADAAPQILEHALEVIEVALLFAAVHSFFPVLIFRSSLVRQFIDILVWLLLLSTIAHFHSIVEAVVPIALDLVALVQLLTIDVPILGKVLTHTIAHISLRFRWFSVLLFKHLVLVTHFDIYLIFIWLLVAEPLI